MYTNKFFQEKSQPIKKVLQPLFFRATKDQSCIYLLRTNHQLPTTVLPDTIINCMSQTQTLCCERVEISIEELRLLVALEPFDESVNNR